MDAEFQELLAQYRRQLELAKGFGVEFVPRTQAAAPQTAPKTATQKPPSIQVPAPAEPPVPKPVQRETEPPAAAKPVEQPRRTPPRQYSDQPQRRGFSDEPSLPVVPAAPVLAPDDIFNELRQQVLTCRKCDLCKTRRNPAFGEGDPKTDLVFVGEGPGEDEDRQGRPFVGRAGRLLTKIIHDGMKLHRHKVYICNVVKCRPPDEAGKNRAPTPNEMVICRPYLMQQLRTIKPKIIVALGATAIHGLLGEKPKMGEFRGIFREWEGIRLMPTYHPAYLLRNYTQAARAAVWEDMKNVMKYLKETGSPLAP